MDHKGFIGIDFGTTNSHFAYSRLDQDPPRATPVMLGDSQGGSVSTCVLWKAPARGEEDFYLYGDKAIEEWIMMDAEARPGHRFSAGFKPDLVSMESARLDAWAFLRQAYLEMRRTRQPPVIGAEQGVPVIIGVPAEIGEAHRQITAEIGARAGFGKVSCLAEPLGALAYHLAHGQISEAETQQGVVVVDFGGGTLDVALLDDEGVREPWGNPLLGGRLFDDIFFQWVTETSGTDLGQFSPDELLYGWHVGCRKLKERFSRHWSSRGVAAAFDDFKGRVEVSEGEILGVLKNASLEEFLARARAYRPSPVAREYFAKLGSDLRHLGAERPVDLLEMTRAAIASGPALQAGRDFAVVILTGGSSSWPFMSALVSELFGVAEDGILRAAAPERTIGEGLAIYNSIRYRHRLARQSISNDLFNLKQRIDRGVDAATSEATTEVTAAIVNQVMEVARAQYLHWHAQGGSLTGVEREVMQACRRIPMNAIVQKRLDALSGTLQTMAIQTALNWLERHGVRGASLSASELHAGPVRNDFNVTISFDVGKTVGTQISQILSGIAALLVAMLSGGSGIALISTGPLGLLVGAILGGGAVFAGRDKIRQAVYDYQFQGVYLRALRMLFSKAKLEARLNEGEQELRQILQQRLSNEVTRFKPLLERHADAAAQEALKRFGILDRLR